MPRKPCGDRSGYSMPWKNGTTTEIITILGSPKPIILVQLTPSSGDRFNGGQGLNP